MVQGGRDDTYGLFLVFYSYINTQQITVNAIDVCFVTFFALFVVHCSLLLRQGGRDKASLGNCWALPPLFLSVVFGTRAPRLGECDAPE